MSRNRINVIVENRHIDLFEDTKIILKQKIQDARDISKVFTDFTEEFEIPSSKTNNSIFGHSFRKDSVDFDLRGFYSCTIEVNNGEYSRGFIELISGDFKSGRANKYKVRYYGGLLMLSRVLKEDRISDKKAVFGDLTFPQDPAAFRELLITSPSDTLDTSATIWDGFNTEAINDSVRVFMNNDTTQGYKFDTSTSFTNNSFSDNEINVAYTDWTTDADADSDTRKGVASNGISTTNLKSSVKESEFLKRLEIAYSPFGLKFSRGLDSKGNPTSVIDDVVAGKEHFFASDEFLSTWILFYNKNIGGAIGTRTLLFENKWFWTDGDGDLLVKGYKGLRKIFNVTEDFALKQYVPIRPYYENIRNFADIYLQINLTADTQEEWTLTTRYNDQILSEGTFTQSGDLVKEDEVVIMGSGGEDVTLNGTILIDSSELFNDQDGSSFGFLTFEVSSENPVNITGTVNTHLVWKRDVFLGTRVHKSTIENTIDETATASANYTVENNTPHLKTIDYFSGLSKVYNLIYALDRDSNGDNIITARTYDEFYNIDEAGIDAGDVLNLTQSVDTQSYQVGKPVYYTEVDFKYDEAKTFQIEEWNSHAAQGENYEQLRYEEDIDEESLVPSRKYDVENPFAMMLFNNPTDTNEDATDTSTVAFVYPWLVDNSYSAVEVGLFRHYGDNHDITLNGAGILLKDNENVAYDEQTTINIPSLHRYNSDDEIQQMLLYRNTQDPRTLDMFTEDSPSLFVTYWSNCIRDLYNSFAKVHRFNARLNRRDLASLELSKNILISDNTYRINEIDIDLMTGTSILELISLNRPVVSQSFRSAYEGGFFSNTITIDSLISDGGFNLFAGTDIILTVMASGGNGVLKYKWYLNGSEVAGETSSTYALTPSNEDTVYVEVSDDTYSVDSIMQTFSVVAADFTLSSVTVNDTILEPAEDTTITATVNGAVGVGYRIDIVNAKPTSFIANDVLSKVEGTIGSDGTDTFTIEVPESDGELTRVFQVMVTNKSVPSNAFLSNIISQANFFNLILFNDDFVVTQDGDNIVTTD